MLHTESRKDGSQGYGAIAVAIIVLLLIAACIQQQPRETEEERVARERLQLLSDSAQDAEKRLGQFLSMVHDSLPADRQVNQYYADGGEWLWVSADDTTALLRDADSLALFLERKAVSVGLPPETFFTMQIRRDISHLRTLDFDSAHVGTGTVPDPVSPVESMARVELNLSRAFVRCAMGLRYGFVDPHKALNNLDQRSGGGFRQVYDIEIEQPTENFAAEALAHISEPEEYLNGLEPADTIYQRLRERLQNDTTAAGRKLAICNMERLRWRHKDKPLDGQRRVFVNIPSQQLWAIGPDSVFSMKICCGAWATKTPLLTSKVRLIQLNPEWNIPFPIMRDEVSRHAGDSAYFARHNYYIVRNSTGETINPKHVSADQLRKGGYRVSQRSGAGNSLGRIIFRFANKFDVYLHDTNNRRAFNAERRTLSHGCVRVERPFDLAMFLLPDADEWLLDRMRLSIDMKPESDKGKEYMEKRKENGDEGPVRLISTQGVSPTVPVALDYYTLYPNPETGIWETWRDRYEYDDQIMRRLQCYR